MIFETIIHFYKWNQQRKYNYDLIKNDSNRDTRDNKSNRYYPQTNHFNQDKSSNTLNYTNKTYFENSGEKRNILINKDKASSNKYNEIPLNHNELNNKTHLYYETLLKDLQNLFGVSLV